MTAEEFARMPLLLERAQVLAVTGWSARTLARAVSAGKVRRSDLGKYRGKYVKADVARICSGN